ncbi:MAG: hypothetical protein ACRD1D_17775 [Acidimicrobiales bacterium]
MRRIPVVLAVTALSLFLGFGAAATAQTTPTLPGVPAGQGGPDNNVNATQQGGTAPGGRDNPAADAGPATATEDDSSIAPWLIGAAVLLLLIAGAAFLVRRTLRSADRDRREPSYSA